MSDPTKEWSAEYEVMKNETMKICKSFKNDRQTLAASFFQKNLITEKVHDENMLNSSDVAASVQLMFNNLKSQVSLKSDTFYEIIEILRNIIGMEILAEYLEKAVIAEKEKRAKIAEEQNSRTKSDLGNYRKKQEQSSILGNFR